MKAESPIQLRLARCLLALWILITVAQNYLARPDQTMTGSVNFFSYFTNDSNIIAAAVLIASALTRSDGTIIASLRGASVVYMTTTGIVYQLLLHGGFGSPVLHIVAPIAVVADWLCFPPRTATGPRASLLWISFPVAWIVYTLLRGGITGWYPYSFLSPGKAGGTIGVLAYVLGIGVAILAMIRVARLRRPALSS